MAYNLWLCLSREIEQVGKNPRYGIGLLALWRKNKNKNTDHCSKSIVTSPHTEHLFPGLGRGHTGTVAAWGRSLGSLCFRMCDCCWGLRTSVEPRQAWMRNKSY